MKFGRKVLYAVCLPFTLTVSYPAVLLACLVGLAHKLHLEPDGVLTATWRPSFAKHWPFSTTLGYGMIFHPSADRGLVDVTDTRIEKHERVHTFQIQDQMVVSLLLGGAFLAFWGGPYISLGIWWSGGTWQLTNFLTAILRHGPEDLIPGEPKSLLKRYIDNAYRQSEHERSAYAQTDMVAQLGGHNASWQDLQRSWIDFERGNRKAWAADQ
jgi:hypothetical protein